MSKDSNSPYISVVTPVYGSNVTLFELYNRLINTLNKITSNFEIIMVNDASPDGSWDLIKELVDRDNKVKGINLSRNFGQHYAISAGLDFSRGEWVVVMDCDLQDQPEEIIKLYNKAQEGFDIVLGRRYNRQDGFWKKFGSKIFYKVFSYLTDTEQDGTVANFGIYHRKVINVINNMKENLRFFPTMVKWVGFHSTHVDVNHSLRLKGKSSYSIRKLFKLAFDVIVSFSYKPLKLTIKLGFFMSLFSFVYALYIVCNALLGIKPIEGWSSLFVSIWFLSGLIIFILGIMGIYISKIFDEVKKRPLYIVGEMYVHKNINVFDEPEGLIRTEKVY